MSNKDLPTPAKNPYAQRTHVQMDLLSSLVLSLPLDAFSNFAEQFNQKTEKMNLPFMITYKPYLL